MSHESLAQLTAAGVTASRSVILHDVNLLISPGDILGISGPNGSGKTTLIRLLATLIRPTSGKFDVLGITNASTRDETVAARRDIALVGHSPAIWPELTLAENIEIVDALNGTDNEVDALRAVGLAAAGERRADRASLGMQRRVEFARLLRRTPTLLLLDEAHAGLDGAATAIVDAVVGQVTAAGGAAVLVSHEPGRMTGLVTRSALLADGTLVEEGP